MHWDINISKECIDETLLNTRIEEFRCVNNCYPYLFMNKDTMWHLAMNNDVKFHVNDAEASNGVKGTYEGSKVFIDSSKKFGQVELR